MAGTLDIKRRINSIKNTKKVTKAMEIVSAAKMKKSTDRVIALRPYANAMYEMFANIAPNVAKEHPLLASREVNKVVVVVIASNKGLCGSFNSALAKLVREITLNKHILSENKEVVVDFVTVGKKADKMVKLSGYNPIASFPEIIDKRTSESIIPLVKFVFDSFEKGEYDKVVLVYTDYVNALVQNQKVRQLLPVSKKDLASQLKEMDSIDSNDSFVEKKDYLLEPSSEEVLEDLVPRVLESQVLHALLESNASEESARMMAMKNATEAASDIVDSLTLTYNKLRQAKITQEISEISAGSAALE